MASGYNTFEGGTDGTTISDANSGGASGDATTGTTTDASNTCEFDTAQARGAMSAHFAVPATVTAQTWVEWAEDIGSGDCWYSIEYRKAGNPTVGSFFYLMRIDESSPDGRAAGLSIRTDGLLRFEDQAGEITGMRSTTAIPSNQWVRIEMRLNRTAGTAQWWMYLDPDSALHDETKSGSGLDLGASTLHEVLSGVISTITNMNGAPEWWIDNVRWSNVGKIGVVPNFRAGGSTSYNSASPVVNKPTGVVDGDYILIYFLTDAAHTINSTSNGFTQLSTTQDSGDAVASLFGKIASGEGSSWTFTNLFTATSFGNAVVLAYSGVDPNSPVHQVAGGTATGAGPISAPSITTTKPWCTIVHFLGADGEAAGSADPDDTPAAVQRNDENTGASFLWSFAQEHIQDVAGAIQLQARNLAEADDFAQFQIALAGDPGAFEKSGTGIIGP